MCAQQNLVPNGSFEDTIGCPSFFDELYKAKYWYSPTSSSPDYFNACNSSLNTVSVPFNGGGNQFAKSGIAYSGFSVGFDTNGTFNYYREYIQTKLNSKLTASKKYKLKFYVNRADSFFVSLKNIGAYLSQNPISCNCTSTLFYSPQISCNYFITDANNWTLIEGDFFSNGTEEFLTIGYFKDNCHDDTLMLRNEYDNYAYYYVDDISITTYEDTVVFPNIFSPNGDGINDVFYFNTDDISPVVLTIINRWGLKVFDSDKHFSWDGRTTSGEPCNVGTYYYIIQTETKIYKGFLELIR